MVLLNRLEGGLTGAAGPHLHSRAAVYFFRERVRRRSKPQRGTAPQDGWHFSRIVRLAPGEAGPEGPV